jgi:hypothetical protein
MQVNPHIDDVFFSQMSSFLFFLSPSMIAKLPATSADKRYAPVYAFWLRPSQGGFGLSTSTTLNFTGYFLFRGVVYVSSE